MRRSIRLRRIIVAAVVGALMASCSGDAEIRRASDLEPGDPTEWLRWVCTMTLPWGHTAGQGYSLMFVGGQPEGTWRDQDQALLRDVDSWLGDAARTADVIAYDLGTIGALDVEGGQELAFGQIQMYREVADLLRGAEEELDPSDPTTGATAGQALQRVASRMQWWERTWPSEGPLTEPCPS
ncbi:MAG: hypothetical protein ACXIVQ_03005 [Acidimicrobiales bacterium]